MPDFSTTSDIIPVGDRLLPPVDNSPLHARYYLFRRISPSGDNVEVSVDFRNEVVESGLNLVRSQVFQFKLNLFSVYLIKGSDLSLSADCFWPLLRVSSRRQSQSNHKIKFSALSITRENGAFPAQRSVVAKFCVASTV